MENPMYVFDLRDKIDRMYTTYPPSIYREESSKLLCTMTGCARVVGRKEKGGGGGHTIFILLAAKALQRHRESIQLPS